MSSQHSPEESADISNRYMGRGGRSSDTIVTQMIELNRIELNGMRLVVLTTSEQKMKAFLSF